MSETTVNVVFRGPQVITTPPARQVVRVDRQTVLIESQRATVVEVLRGAKGERGEPGEGAAAFVAPAGEPISALRPVVLIGGAVFHASHLEANHAGRVAGISYTAASTGDDVVIRTAGSRIVEPAWIWSGDTLFVGDRLLSPTPPAGGFLQRVGVILSPTEILVLIGDPLER